MDLTDDQKSRIASWIREGKTLADVQRLLREEFNLSMTYMDVRFLVDDLDITFAEPEAEEKAADDQSATAEEAELIDEGGDGSVSVDVDAVVRPGALVSGTVTFSDGKQLGWQLNGGGQLGLIPGDDPEYRPSPEDVQEFQEKLNEVLQQKGF
ncbi:MAG: hypothetical protein ACOC4K_00870 [Verrucomicrobiota bacterium]